MTSITFNEQILTSYFIKKLLLDKNDDDDSDDSDELDL